MPAAWAAKGNTDPIPVAKLANAGAAPDPTLILTYANASGVIAGSLADFNAMRTALNGGSYGELLVEVEYPRTFSTITDGLGYTRAKFWIPDGLNVPIASGSDTYFREFGGTYSDQSGTAEALSLNIRPGGVVKF